MRAAATILDVRNVTKKYGKETAISDISFQVREGEIYGLIGPSGSGKSTVIKSIVGHLRPTSGMIEINHYNVRKEFTDAIDFVGAIVEYPVQYPYLTGWQNLKLSANMFPEITKDRMKEVLELVGLREHSHKKVKRYSLNMKKRLAIAQSILHYPHLLVLDEPMNGLDPVGMREVYSLIRSIADNGVAVLIASNLYSEMEEFCDRVGIMSHGHLIAQQDMGAFRRARSQLYSVMVDDADKAEQVLLQHFEGKLDILKKTAALEESAEKEDYEEPRYETVNEDPFNEDTLNEDTISLAFQNDPDFIRFEKALRLEEESHREKKLRLTKAFEDEQEVLIKQAVEPVAEADVADAVKTAEKAFDELVIRLRDANAAGINRVLIENGIEVGEIDQKKQTLEELFIQLTGGAEIA